MLSLIVLAAGKSTRMRGPNKLLVEVAGKPMVRRVVEAALNSKVDELIVVVGWQADQVRDVLADLPCHFVKNRDYESGQSSSVKAGLGAVGPQTRAVLVLPADVALVDSRSINLVVEEYIRNKASIVVASYRGKLGHPILFDRKLFSEIMQIDEKTFGLKSVIEKNRSDMKLIEASSENILRDVDTPEDLAQMLT